MTNRRLVTLALIALLSPHAAQGSGLVQGPRFASCGWWQSQNADNVRLYTLGFAQGVVIGSVAGPSELFPGLPQTPAESALLSAYKTGAIALLQRPALMEEAFNVKCKDYRNAMVDLSSVALLVTLEIGGSAPERIEAALQLYRADQFPARTKIVEALLKR